MAAHNWQKEIQPLIQKYKDKKFPLNYGNTYELVIMVILAAQDSDAHINKVAPELFKVFPNMQALSNATEETLFPILNKVRNFANKSRWLIKLAGELKEDKNIPLTMDELTELPGIGRKSANVIMRESGVKADGVIVDLHVVRVGPRLGIASGTDPKKIEKQIMEVIDQKDWGEVGMAISFLGRETCRPTNPKHSECVMKDVCDYYKSVQ